MFISENELRAIPAPTPTKSWNPIPHSDILNQVQTCCKEIGIEIIESKFDTNKTGSNVFVTHKLDFGFETDKLERYPELGWRNSVSKQLSLGFTAGLTIIVCSNLVFSGSWVDFRKHYHSLNELTVKEMALTGISEAMKKTTRLGNTHDKMKELPRDKFHKDYLFMEFLRNGVISSRQILDLSNAYDEEKTRYGENLYTIFNCATQCFRELALQTVSERSSKLNEIIDIDMAEAA